MENSWQAPWKRGRKPALTSRFTDGEVVCEDAMELLSSLRRASADIVFLDPPFNLGKEYGTKTAADDLRNETEYRTYMSRVFRESVHILKPGGALYLYHLPFWAFQFAGLLQKKLTFRHWIAIAMKNGFARGEALYPAHYGLLYFTKGKPAYFNRPKIPTARCRHCKKPIKDYGGYKEFVADGVNLSDFWEDLSPVRHKKTRDANELPIALLRRVVAISGAPGGLVVDPFAGSGTSLVAARERAMRFVGGDYDQQNCSVMVQRLTEAGGVEIPQVKST